MAEKNEVIYWAENEAEAVVVIARLEEAGIQAIRVRESYGSMNALSFGILGEIGIAVRREDAAKAEAILIDDEEVPAEDSDEDFIDPDDIELDGEEPRSN